MYRAETLLVLLGFFCFVLLVFFVLVLVFLLVLVGFWFLFLFARAKTPCAQRLHSSSYASEERVTTQVAVKKTTRRPTKPTQKPSNTKQISRHSYKRGQLLPEGRRMTEMHHLLAAVTPKQLCHGSHRKTSVPLRSKGTN